MEHWTIYVRPQRDAIPWPYARSFDQFRQDPQPLIEPHEDFGRVSPSDGQSETPLVPAHLPRAHPRGTYRLGLYHDPDALYVILEAHDPPALPGLEERRSYSALTLLSSDGRYVENYILDDRGQTSARVGHLLLPPRRTAAPEPASGWSITTMPFRGGEMVAWRIGGEALARALSGRELRLSVSRLCLRGIEAVAMGALYNWATRADEMLTVHLVQEAQPLPWPQVRRIDMAYDPAAETGRFTVHWQDPYVAEEIPEPQGVEVLVPVPWLRHAMHLNGAMAVFDASTVNRSEPMPLRDGVNIFDAQCAGGPQTRVVIEKMTGQRVLPSPHPPVEPMPCDELRAWILSEAHAALAEDAAAHAGDKPRDYAVWNLERAAAMGRASHYFGRDDRLLAHLREIADHALALQREDGTFAGFHLRRIGAKPQPWAGGAYDSGQAGELWVVAHRILGDAKYLAASCGLLQAYSGYPIEFNQNYAAFALYHLTAHYRATRDAGALDRALYYARHCVATDLLPLGYHAGHNFYTCYGGITLRGMALLCAVLPPDHSYRPELREKVLRMTNQLVSRMQPNGYFDALDRNHIGQHLWIRGIFTAAMLLEPGDAARADGVIQQMLRCDRSLWQKHVWSRAISSDVIHYAVHRDALLAGDPVDLPGLI